MKTLDGILKELGGSYINPFYVRRLIRAVFAEIKPKHRQSYSTHVPKCSCTGCYVDATQNAVLEQFEENLKAFLGEVEKGDWY